MSEFASSPDEQTDISSQLIGSRFLLEGVIGAIRTGGDPEMVIGELTRVSSIIGNAAIETAKLQEQSRYDSLTGLLSAEGFKDSAVQAIERYYYSNDKNHPSKYELHSQYTWLSMEVDMDGLKRINDKYGHDAGDQAIQAVANGIRLAIRPDDIAVRWHGDEFGVFLRPDTSGAIPKDMNKVGQTVEDRLNSILQAAEFTDSNGEVHQGLSVTAGFSAIHSAEQIEEARKQADLMLIEKKHAKKKTKKK